MAAPTAASGAMRLAVISTRPIPPPPYLPGQALQVSSAAPALPGQPSAIQSQPGSFFSPNILLHHCCSVTSKA